MRAEASNCMSLWPSPRGASCASRQPKQWPRIRSIPSVFEVRTMRVGWSFIDRLEIFECEPPVTARINTLGDLKQFVRLHIANTLRIEMAVDEVFFYSVVECDSLEELESTEYNADHEKDLSSREDGFALSESMSYKLTAVRRV